VQYPKKGGYWAYRVKILINGTEHWITIPIVRAYSGTRLINEMEINNSVNWHDKALRTIEVNYCNAPFYYEAYPIVKQLLSQVNNNLAEYNLSITYSLCKILGIDSSKMIKSSTIKHEGTATDLLISMIKQCGANAYMCGGGASKYQEDEKFEQAGIKLIYQNFVSPVYPQLKSAEFVPGLSIIDPLMNTGIEGVKKLLGLL
jgi:hypothetical protein